MIMSQVIYSALLEQYPNINIDVLAPSATLPLLTRMPEVNRGILIDQTHGQVGLSYRFRLGAELGGNNYDWAIVTPNSLKSALVPFAAGIPLRTGFLGEYRYFLLNDINLLNKARQPLMTDRFLALVGKTSAEMIPPRLCVDLDSQAAFLGRYRLATDKPVIGFCPGAEFGDAKKWPEAHYGALAIYGSTSPAFTPPISETAQIVSRGLDCSPCFKRTCPLGHKNCLNKLMPEQVLERL
jgi:heptosyltransferase-2